MNPRDSQSTDFEHDSQGSQGGGAAPADNAALRDSEQRFRQIAEAIDHVFWVTELRPVECVSYVSPAFERIWGRTAEALYADARLWVQYIHPEDRTTVGAAFERWLHDPDHCGYAVEYRIVRPDGEVRWISDRGQLARDAENRVYRATGVAEDITARKRAEAHAQEMQQQFRVLAESLPQLVWASDATGAFDYLGPQWATYTGQPVSTQLGFGWLDLLHPDDRSGITRRWLHTVQTGAAFDAELRLRRHDGEHRWFMTRALPQRDEAGRVMRWFGTCTDITERKHAEQALAQSEAQFEAVFANLGEGVAVCTPEGQLTHWNRAAYQMHDIEAPADMPSGHQFDPQFEVHDASGAPVPESDWALARILRGELLMNHEAHVHNVVKGWHRVFNYGGALVRDADGQPRFAVMHMSDITERKRAEAEIHALNTQLEQRVQERTAELREAVRELEAFSYSVSHDLRAPLRALDGFSQALLQDYSAQVPETGQRYLKIIRESAQKMGQLIDDLLAFSRVGRQQPKLRAVDHAMLVRSALQQLAPMTQGRQIELRIGALPPGRGDPAMLQQVWVNLLSNALKYSRNTAAAVVEVGALPGPDGPEYFVRDNGTGFDMRYAHKLFGVFERLHRSEDFEGTGVGLAIVQRIVQRHGGSIRAEGELGRGATFTFQLGRTAEP